MKRSTSLLARVAAPVAILVTILGLTAPPASAVPVAFTTTILGGSSITVGSQVFDVGTPACSTAKEDDANTDGGSFAAGDPQCASALDANERLAGLQAYVAPRVTGTFDTATDTYAGLAVTFPAAELCVTTTQCLTVTISTVGAVSATLNPTTGVGSLSVSLRVDLDAAVGFGGLGAGCAITPIPTGGGTATLNTANYSNVTGNATYTAAGIPVPGTSGCGFLYGPIINAAIGVPGTASANFLTDTNPVLV